MITLKIQKRNTSLEEFDQAKLTSSLESALRATYKESFTEKQKEKINIIGDAILQKLSLQYPDGGYISSENLASFVEQILADQDEFEAAKAFILFRAERSRIRAEKRITELEENGKARLHIVKTDGRKQIFSLLKIKNYLREIGKDLGIWDEEALLQEIQKMVFDGITTSQISNVITLAIKSFIERDPVYSLLCARTLLTKNYHEVFAQKFNSQNLDKLYRESFERNIKQCVMAGRMSEKLLDYDFRKLSSAFVIERDKKLNYLGLQTLYDRYFIQISDRRMEAPQHFWMRVAMGIALAEKKELREEKAITFYHVLSELRALSSTPTLFNAGTMHSQCSSCYLSTIEDNLDHIFKVIHDNANLSKWAGGIGNDWSNVRATNSRIHGTNGRSQGVIPFMKVANDTALAVNQGGKRKGAVCAYLECWHLDFEEFLDLRKNTGDDRRRTHDMNTAAWIPDLFMKRVRDNGKWTLFSPSDVPGLHDAYGKKFETLYEQYEKMAQEEKIENIKTVEAASLWRKMITMLFETGHPWITFKDPCNIRSPQDHCGVIHDSNLCTEITLNNSAEETAVCNLASVNLAQHFDAQKKNIDWNLLGNTVETAIRMLDNVIDVNFYPTKETQTANSRHRPVGLGLMGLQDLFYKLDIPFDSHAAVEYSDKIMEFISYHSILASSVLAKERKPYSSYKGSKWDRNIFPQDTIALLEQERSISTKTPESSSLDWKIVRDSVQKYGMRNSNCMAIAPTATIANIAGCVPCTEPIYKNLYVKSNMGGEFTVINSYLVEDLEKENLWNQKMLNQIKYFDGSIQDIPEVPHFLKEKYKEVFEIDALWIILHAQARGKWIDQSQSINLFNRGTEGKKISDMYFFAWECGLKTTYYLRNLAASRIQKSTIDERKHGNIEPEKKEISEEAKMVCSILNGTACEACQ